MKIKLLLFILLLSSFKLVNAQWTNEIPANAWVYNFTSGTAATLTSNNTTISNLSSGTGAFLPAPPSGVSRVHLPPSSSTSFQLIPSTNKLVKTSTINTTVSKFAVYGVANSSAVVTASFILEFTGKVGTDAPLNNTGCQIGLGTKIAGSTANPFESGASFFSPSSNNRCLFNSIRIQYNSTNDNYAVAYRASGTTTTSTTNIYTNLNGGTLSPGVAYKVDIYCNNAAIPQSYKVNNDPYTVPAGNYHLWITNMVTNVAVRYFLGTNTFDIPKTIETGGSTDYTMPNSTILNSFLIQSDAANTNGLSKITINGGMSLSYDLSTLPVSLTSFTGSLRNSEVALSWQTASELNNDYFTVLRAGDDKNFQELDKVPGNGNSNQIRNYNFIDKNPLLGNNYYKLKQVDKDGSTTIHEKLVVVKASLNETAFNITNERDNSIKVNILADHQVAGNLEFYNINGQRVFQTSIALNKGINQFIYDFTSLPSGIYVAKVSAGSLQLNKKFLK